MKINIVIREGDLGWILGRLAKELHQRLRWSINEKGADIDYCIPYYIYREATAPIKIPLFTHKEKDGGKREMFEKVSMQAKKSICLSEDTKKHIPLGGHVIHLGSDLNKGKTFGIVGKDYNTGRKNFHWLPKLKEEFTIIHQGLGEEITNRRSFYSGIDYLIVTSSIEGGPVPLLDAIATGVPVIAPDTGWCWEYPCIHYEKDNLTDLQRVLRQLNTARTWAGVAEDHRIIFEKFV